MDDMHNHVDSCDCDFDEDQEPQHMTLLLEDNKEVKCIVIGIFEVDEYEGKEYIALLSEDGNESYVYEYVENNDNEDGFELLNIESDEEFDIVVSAIDEILEEDEEYVYDDDDYEYVYEDDDYEDE